MIRAAHDMADWPRQCVKGDGEMNKKQIKETLEKQLKLLSECSERNVTDHDLVEKTEAMISLSKLLLSFGKTN